MQERFQGGFTLIELMVVLAVFSLIGFALYPSCLSRLDSFRLRADAREIVSLLQLARNMAVLKGERYGVEFCNAEGMYALVRVESHADATDDQRGRLRHGIHFEELRFPPGDAIASFTPEGIAARAGTVKLENRGGERLAIRIQPVSGRIRLEGPEPAGPEEGEFSSRNEPVVGLRHRCRAPVMGSVFGSALNPTVAKAHGSRRTHCSQGVGLQLLGRLKVGGGWVHGVVSRG